MVGCNIDHQPFLLNYFRSDLNQTKISEWPQTNLKMVSTILGGSSHVDVCSSVYVCLGVHEFLVSACMNSLLGAVKTVWQIMNDSWAAGCMDRNGQGYRSSAASMLLCRLKWRCKMAAPIPSLLCSGKWLLYTSSISFTVYGWHTLANLSAHGDSVVYILQSSTSNVIIMRWCNRKTAGLRAVRLLLAQTLAHDILKTNTPKMMHKKTPLISTATQHINILLRICWGNEHFKWRCL